MAMHPYSRAILDNAASTNNKSVFGRVLITNLDQLAEEKKRMNRSVHQARGFEPIAMGQTWMTARDSILIKALHEWPEAKARIDAIAGMLHDNGLLQDDTADNEYGVCDVRYYKMIDDFTELLKIIDSELEDVKEFILSLNSSPYGPASSNFVRLYEGSREELEQAVDSALPRAEAMQQPALAFTLSHANQDPLLVTFKKSGFAIMDLNVQTPVWVVKLADPTVSFGEILKTPGCSCLSDSFGLTKRLVIIQFSATARMERPPRRRVPLKRRARFL
ncbi:unnamed protein product [Oikopleura dioica]|uniref:Uncharacterized protein n=1 Tax=Oikopleura dioica TaxID=34765 RepID=E4X5Z0_OIKDI|nr:unnamed protein product [Oikopleura dioica]